MRKKNVVVLMKILLLFTQKDDVFFTKKRQLESKRTITIEKKDTEIMSLKPSSSSLRKHLVQHSQNKTSEKSHTTLQTIFFTARRTRL